ncbi:Lrp/AsnC family transcriptional regulator [Oceanospirillum sediminis]|uniref:Lrp/AsnC family transcriptional regulator n=1 Tax=Oceanospirillum sediminis TaxID=2760088 RepID=A0A839IU36_9GAMM|nr:Lrp/AsnC family transcriptional regulator [Oceanospirillum sediminis]MBB1488865.1 Lrp/AsnC family transcriptional regulator [Oceanospirillum sediminis]
MQEIALDRYDISILNILQQNCQVPRLELAERVGLSSSQCFRRLKRLEDVGIIERYAAVLNREKAGMDVSVAMMVQYRKSEVNAREKTIQLIEQTPVIYECFSVTGEYDFLLRVYCKTMKEFNTLVNETFQTSFISGLHSYMLMSCIKDAPVLTLSDD